MTRRQRVLDEVKKIVRNNALGAGRTAALDAMQQKYEVSDGRLKAWCIFVQGADYWKKA